jgi:hypothetical protein
LSPDSLGVEYLPLAPGGLVYVFADVDAGRSLLDRFVLGGISGGQVSNGQTADILEMTRYAVAAVYPDKAVVSPGSPSAAAIRNVQAAAWGKYPSARAGFFFTFSKDWKKRKSALGKSYWYSARNGLSVALNAGQAFAAMGVNPDPFAPPPGMASPAGFAEFRRGAALSLWVENPAVPLNRFLSRLELPLQIPAEQLFINLFPEPEQAASAAPGSASYEAHLRIKTPSVSQARALVTIFSMVRLFASNATGMGDFGTLLPILFANPPVQDGAFLNIRTAPVDEGEVALLFGLFSVYSTQN